MPRSLPLPYVQSGILWDTRRGHCDGGSEGDHGEGALVAHMIDKEGGMDGGLEQGTSCYTTWPPPVPTPNAPLLV